MSLRRSRLIIENSFDGRFHFAKASKADEEEEMWVKEEVEDQEQGNHTSSLVTHLFSTLCRRTAMESVVGCNKPHQRSVFVPESSKPLSFPTGD